MLEILTIILPIFLVIAIGYVSVRTGLIEQSILSGLGRFVLVIALPAMIIMALANTDLESIFQPAFFLVYGGGMLLCYLLMFLFARRVMGDDLALAGIKSFGASFPNSVFVGYALLLRAFDDPPVAALAMVLMVENILMMPLLLSVLEIGSKGRSGGWGDTAATLLRTLATNPIIIAIVIGTTLAVLDVSLPSIVSGSLGMLGNASAGVALFFIGGTLAGVTVLGNSSDIAQITAFKLIVHPLIVAGLRLPWCRYFL